MRRRKTLGEHLCQLQSQRRVALPGMMTRLLQRPRTGRAPAGGVVVEAEAKATQALAPIEKLAQTAVRGPKGSSSEVMVLGAEAVHPTVVAAAAAEGALTTALAARLAARLADARPAAAMPTAAKPAVLAETRQRVPRGALVPPEAGAAPRAAAVAAEGARPSRNLLYLATSL